MTSDPDRWSVVERIFHEALARPVNQRRAFLQEVCAGDERLRREVQRLLEAAASAEGILKAPAPHVAAAGLGESATLTGQRLGVYEVHERIGAGGMGEVYRAGDSRLGRDVAIKILPRAFTADPDRLARFEREARILAALNHPNIAAIYGFEEESAAGGLHLRGLVLELVEGETLADRIARGPLRIPDALDIAEGIAEALDAAHEKGIVHRDLKPANIKITPAGTVKVLDFGLAKLTQPSGHGPEGPDQSQSPTVSIGATGEGVVLGTVAYMSPEQARGQAVDKRTDIWAFGCVVYEMLTGRAAFAAHTISDTIAAILDREADWTRLSSNTPAPVQRLLQRCLEKDPRRRLRDIADAAVEISEGRRPAESRQGTGRRLAVPVIGALLMGGVVAGTAVWMLKPRAAPSAERAVQFVVASGDADALEPSGLDRDIAISPDGTRLVYLSGGPGRIQLVTRALDQLETTLLWDRGSPRAPFVSSDGRWVGFFELFGNVKKVSTTGGPITDVARSVGGAARGATWYEDTIIFATTDAGTGLWRVSAAGGEPAVLTRPDSASGELDHFWPEILPGGRAVLFTVVSAASLEPAEIAVLDLATGARKVVVRGGTHGQYVPTGHLIYGAAGALHAVPFDIDQLQTSGEAVKVLDQVAITPEGAVNAVFSQEGTMVYVPAAPERGRRTLVWVDREGREDPIAAPPRPYIYPRVSPDGGRVAVEVWDESRDIWIWDLMRETLTRITDNPGRDGFPVWTPDSRRVIFGSARNASTNLFWRSADGIGPVDRLTDSQRIQFPYSVSPDGSQLVIREDDPETGLDVSMVSLTAERRTNPLMRTAFNEQNAEVSPDGRWLVYQSNESGQDEIYVRPFPAVGEGRWQISTTGGTRPLWARSGRELFYLAPGGLSSVIISPETAFKAGPPTVLIGRRYFAESAFIGRTYDISPDGRRFLMIKESNAAGRPQIVIVQNWTEALKRFFTRAEQIR